MARSRQHSPVWTHTTARSEKKDKQAWHRRWRAKKRSTFVQAWRRGEEYEHMGVSHRAVSSPWRMAKDGKYWDEGWLAWCRVKDPCARRAWIAIRWRK